MAQLEPGEWFWFCFQVGTHSFVGQRAFKSFLNHFGTLLADRQILYEHITQPCKAQAFGSKTSCQRSRCVSAKWPMRSSCTLELCPFICSRFYLILYYTENEYLPSQLKQGHLSGELLVCEVASWVRVLKGKAVVSVPSGKIGTPE